MTAARHIMDSISDDEETGAIHRVDTVPPPEGEDDAYNAATRVGPMAGGLIAELMAQAEEGQALSGSTPASGVRSLTFPKPAPVLHGAPPSLPHLSDQDEGARPVEKTVLLAARPPESTRFDRRLVDSAIADAQMQAAADQARAAAMPLACEPAPRSAAAPVTSPAPAALAPLLEPAPPAPAPAPSSAAEVATEKSPSIGLEAAIFVLSFLAVAVPAIYVCLRWM